ncbi:uncharacterized protein LOC130991854 [Salvia miltiorrhiza]|uniref:uncharacterized protein LOC130991854 n=1 Tax=Salvia miltiorrhiza TaxID=226208 RepID=UPI0025AC1DA9|nr:uncharacterized protein LOC130991854 [Salvia miltiorrhiza]
MVMEVVHEDMGEGSMQCTNHPYKNSTPGGICAFCLQEKLGKLVSSSFPVAIFPSSSSSSSSRSDFGAAAVGDAALQPRPLAAVSANASENASSGECNYYSRRSRLPFVLTQKKKKKKDGGGVAVGSSDSGSIVFKRSKSTATPRRGMHFLDENFSDDYSPHRRGFWSFLYMSKPSSVKKSEKSLKDLNFTTPTSSSTVGSSSVNGGGGGSGGIRAREKKREDFVVVDENGSPDQAAFDRKVSRSRSVGCGSRSFSGDFFERISTGFGDCTLRRVESQREGKPKVQAGHRNSGINGQDCIKERVRCGGIFGGFMITSSSSSSSSSSYWISSSAEDNGGNSKAILPARQLSHGRSKSWGWALASPMRAFSKPSSVKRDNASKNVTPNLTAIPSLLAVSG